MDDKVVSERITAIRTVLGNPLTQCPTCCCEASNPYRRIVRGRIIVGCVDAFHTTVCRFNTTTASWHNRSVACAIRERTLRDLLSRIPRKSWKAQLRYLHSVIDINGQ